MEGSPDQEQKPVRVGDIQQLYFADRFGIPIDPDSTVRAETKAEVIAISSFGLRVDRESAERMEGQAGALDEEVVEASKAVASGERAVTEHLLGYKLSDDQWEELLRGDSGQADVSEGQIDSGFSLN